MENNVSDTKMTPLGDPFPASSREHGPVPRFIQIITVAAAAFGRADGEVIATDNLYALDVNGRVWEWLLCDPDREGAIDGWKLLSNTIYQDGVDPPAPKKSR